MTLNTGSVPEGRNRTRPEPLSVSPFEAALHRHIDEMLRKQRGVGSCDTKRGPLLAQRAQHRERSNDCIAGGVLIEADDMT